MRATRCPVHQALPLGLLTRWVPGVILIMQVIPVRDEGRYSAAGQTLGENIMTATLDTQALKKLDQAHHLHPFTDFEDYAKHGGRIVSRAEHIYI